MRLLSIICAMMVSIPSACIGLSLEEVPNEIFAELERNHPEIDKEYCSVEILNPGEQKLQFHITAKFDGHPHHITAIGGSYPHVLYLETEEEYLKAIIQRAKLTIDPRINDRIGIMFGTSDQVFLGTILSENKVPDSSATHQVDVKHVIMGNIPLGEHEFGNVARGGQLPFDYYPVVGDSRIFFAMTQFSRQIDHPPMHYIQYAMATQFFDSVEGFFSDWDPLNGLKNRQLPKIKPIPFNGGFTLIYKLPKNVFWIYDPEAEPWPTKELAMLAAEDALTALVWSRNSILKYRDFGFKIYWKGSIPLFAVIILGVISIYFGIRQSQKKPNKRGQPTP